MLILLLDGLWAGVRAQITVYEDNVGADLFVVAPGTRNLFADASSLPLTALDEVRSTSGVEWAAPVRALFSILDLHGRKVAVSLVGYRPGESGGPWAIAAGRTPRAGGEITVDRVLARRHSLRLGDPITVMGREFRIVGTSRGTSAFMTGFAFLTHADVDALLRAPGRTSLVLVGASNRAAVRARLEARGLTVLDRGDLREADLRLATDVYGTPLRLMVAVAFAAGTLVIALTAYAAVAEKRREYGIVKAIGAGPARLVRLALAQTVGLAVLGFVLGLVLFAAGRAVITRARPQFSILLTAGSLTRAAAAAVAMAVVAAVVPARRLARLDPAVAYRGG